MINSTNPFNDPEIKKQLLQEEGIVETPDIEEVESGVSEELQEMISSAPMLPKSAKNIILDSSAINKNLKEANGPCPNPLLAPAVIQEPLKSPELKGMELLSIKKVYEYDIETRPGTCYRIKKR
jgi:hypothetical protein